MMKWRRIIFLVFVAWAGTMYYRYHALAKVFADSYQDQSDDSSGAKHQSFYGGVGNVGGLGKVGNNRPMPGRR